MTQVFFKIITIEESEQEVNNIQTPMTTPVIPLEVITITKENLKEMIATEIQKVEQYHKQQREKLKTELKEEIEKSNFPRLHKSTEKTLTIDDQCLFPYLDIKKKIIIQFYDTVVLFNGDAMANLNNTTVLERGDVLSFVA